MRCPRCACQDDKVIDSRASKEGACVRRRRECLKCGYRFTTSEEIIPNDLKVVKRDGRREPFDPEKIRHGVTMACGKRDIRPEQIDALVNNVSSSIERDFDREVTSLEIGLRVMAALRDLDKVAYVCFASVYRDFKDVSDFITEIRTLNKKTPPEKK